MDFDYSGFSAGEIYPNPFDVSASLQIGLQRPGNVEGKIINGLGQVMKFVTNSSLDAGSHLLTINGKGMVKGIYNLVLTYWNNQEKLVVSKKMVIK